MVRYYGLYSNAHRGKIRKGGVDSSHPLIIEEEDRSMPSKGWAEEPKIIKPWLPWIEKTALEFHV